MASELKAVKIDAQGRVIPKGSSSSVAHWRVTLGKRITGTKKQRRFFKTYGSAMDFIASAEKAQKVQGTEAFTISQKLRVEAMECHKRLEPLGVSLTQAVDYYMRHAFPTGGVKLFSEVCSEFLTSRRAMGCKPRTLVQYESYIAVLTAELGRAKINELKATDVEEWLDEYEVVTCSEQSREMSPRTRHNYLTTLTTIFNYALAKDYIVSNPALKVPKPKLGDNSIGILTPAEAEMLLRVALAESSDMVPGIALGLFAGLRRSEISALEWRHIDVLGGTIVVEGSFSKTRQRRVVTISENLRDWLQCFQKSSGPVAFHPDVFGEKLRELVRAKLDGNGNVIRSAITPKWPHNGLRHSFGSYMYAKTKNETFTAAEMGNSPHIVHKHYRALVKEPDVRQFWQIRPNQYFETQTASVDR